MSNILRASTDFGRVRDGRESPDAYFDVDLSTAQDQTFNIAGNSFYIDANPEDGNATVYFQETDKLRGPTPFYVSPGFIARIPFTQIRVVNSAQIGKKIRVVYGVDTDFQPGSVSQVSFAGNVDVNGAIYNASIALNSLAAGAANQIIAPAANINGIILSNLCVSYVTSSANGFSTLLAKTSPPAAFNDGDALGNTLLTSSGANNCQNFQLINPQFIPPGKGLYLFQQAGTVITSGPFIAASWQQ